MLHKALSKIDSLARFKTLFIAVSVLFFVCTVAIFQLNSYFLGQAQARSIDQFAELYSYISSELDVDSGGQVVPVLDGVQYISFTREDRVDSLGALPDSSAQLKMATFQYLRSGERVEVVVAYQPYTPSTARWLRYVVATGTLYLIMLAIYFVAVRILKRWEDERRLIAERAEACGDEVPNITAIACDDTSLLAPIVRQFNRQIGLLSEHFRKTAVSVSNAEFTGDARTEQLFKRANFDALTGLANRYYLMDRMGYSLASAARNGRKMAVAFIDLDQFKKINDKFGHATGDRILIQAGVRLTEALRRTDLVARLGGDEFLVLLEDVRSGEDAERVASLLLSTLLEPYEINGHSLTVSASIGVSVFPHDGTTASALIQNADTSMYSAKKDRKGLAFFEDTMLESSQWHLTLQYHLTTALKNCEMALQYQPQLDVDTSRIVGVEVLLRWTNPVLGLLFPNDFVDDLNHMELFDDVQKWVFKTACEQYVDWYEQDVAPSVIVVNVDGGHFERGNFEQEIVNIAASTGMPKHCLEIEFSENVLVQSSARVKEAIVYLASHGFRVSIDRFGAGYSSLVSLRNLPINSIKVDQVFIQDIETNEASRAIVEATASLGKAMGVSVGAMGVESKAQAKQLQQLDCSLIQGYCVSEPLEAIDFVNFFKKYHRSGVFFEGGESQSVQVS